MQTLDWQAVKEHLNPGSKMNSSVQPRLGFST